MVNLFSTQFQNEDMAREYGCKVCRVLHERGLDHYDDRLISKWTGEDRMGYRQLARWLNVTLLRREMDRAGLSTLGEEAESKYDRLQSDDATAEEVTDMLKREGILIDELRNDFVSYGVIRTHLTECLGAEYEQQESSDWETETIEISKSHTREKMKSAVSSLLNKGELSGGSGVTLHVAVELECEDCQVRVPLRRALRRGSICDCATLSANETSA